jgi:hypothetical protein
MKNRVRVIFHEPEPVVRTFAVTEAAARPIEEQTMTLEVTPALSPRDEAIFLLHTAAEIEHALMVQYLYAAWSLLDDGALQVQQMQRAILQTAREEMAHFASVQNLLRFVGGPLNFEREDFPFRTEFYPFPFRLEPLSRTSLARYIAAEMPARPNVDSRLLEEVRQLATGGTSGGPVNRVGALYNRLADLFRRLPDSAFWPDTAASVQALPAHWRADVGYGPLFLRPVRSRNDALSLITDIARQGEGEQDMPQSHFLTFLEIFDAWPRAGSNSPTLDVPIHPNTSLDLSRDGDLTAGQISHPRARQWALVFNHHYRMLLTWLQHALLASSSDTEHSGLVLRTFAEMLGLSDVGRLLTTLPRMEGDDQARAGAPFELPYSLAFPDLPNERWAYHRELLDTARMQLEPLGPGASDVEVKVLQRLRSSLRAADAFVAMHTN